MSTEVDTPWGGGKTDNPVVEGSIAGAIILGAAGLCWKVFGK